MNQSAKELACYLNQAKEILIFTGAGISTESGISDYRSKGGLWKRFKPVTIQEFLASEEKRIEYWRNKSELYESLVEAQPNPGHQAVVKINELGKLKGCITQNIDGLHQMAGLDQSLILELHGSNRETICLKCRDMTSWQETRDRLQAGEQAPRCQKCSGYLKPNTISFGQALDPVILETAFRWAGDCDCVLALGSTLVVEPAASIPRIAKQNGAKLIIITMSETPLDSLADLKIEAPIGKVLDMALEAIKNSS